MKDFFNVKPGMTLDEVSELAAVTLRNLSKGNQHTIDKFISYGGKYAAGRIQNVDIADLVTDQAAMWAKGFEIADLREFGQLYSEFALSNIHNADLVDNLCDDDKGIFLSWYMFSHAAFELLLEYRWNVTLETMGDDTENRTLN